jgi:site-specific DNA recombinase
MACRISGRATGNAPFTTGHLYAILNNPLYIGKVRHKKLIHPGEHEAIIAEELWNRVQARLAANAVERTAGKGIKSPSLFVGRIFDNAGNRLTPSHAVKGSKRYRYYATAAPSDGPGPRLRIPAEDIETLVTDALRSFLIDPARVLEAFSLDGHSPSVMKRTIEHAERLVAGLADQAGAARAETIRSLVARVHVSQDDVRIEIDRSALAGKLQVDGSIDYRRDPLCIEHAITLKRKGKEQQLILTSAADHARHDPVLIKAMVRAHRWFAILRSREVGSIAEIGRTENVPRSWISTQLPLVFLAPDIRQAILDGYQPSDCNLDRLIALAGASPDWSEQRKAFRGR